MRTRFVLAALALTAAGCGGGNTDETNATTTTAAPTTTTAAPTTTDATVPSTDAPTTTTSAPEPVMFTERGPYGVGIATLDLGDRLLVPPLHVALVVGAPAAARELEAPQPRLEARALERGAELAELAGVRAARRRGWTRVKRNTFLYCTAIT